MKTINDINKINNIITILDILRWTTSQFNASQIFYGHGTNNSWDETLHLILPSLHLPINTPSEIYHAHLTTIELKKIIKLVKNRIKKYVPVPYLINQAWFCNLRFYVDQRVFIPRSPIGEIITSYLYDLIPYFPNYILDMCTGSAAIAIAIASTYPSTKIDAVDISIDALQIAEYNIQLHNLEHRITPIYSNLFQNVPKLKYDIIISNPPYVNHSDISKLPREFHHEPMLSLSAGDDGLKIIKHILKYAINYLNINGVLICEVGITKDKLIQHYPNIPFYWFSFNKGGNGVFLLTYKQLLYFKNYFNS